MDKNLKSILKKRLLGVGPPSSAKNVNGQK